MQLDLSKARCLLPKELWFHHDGRVAQKLR
jgi:hypothetical protein